MNRAHPLVWLGVMLVLLYCLYLLGAKTAPQPAHAPPQSQPAATQPARTREFALAYACTISGMHPGETARIWLPLAHSDIDQTVQIVGRSLPPGAAEHTEWKYGNHLIYAEARPDAGGSAALRIDYRIERREVIGAGRNCPVSPRDAELFLNPDAKVPVGGKPMKLLAGRNLPAEPMERARLIYDVVDGHMQYRKDKPGYGNGDAVWACDSGFGNCTDFHSLFISLARGEHIPARFIMGFPVPEQAAAGTIPGYHCWAEFATPGQTWFPVDISEASKAPAMKEYYFGHLTPDRVAFTTGRDLTLSPPQAGPPLNFFIYPYVEVAGRPLPSSQVKLTVTYRDLRPAATASR